MDEKDIKLLKESLPVAIERYEYELSVLYDHETKEINILKDKINKIKNLLRRI